MLTGPDITAIREALGWSFAKMASELGVGEGAVRRWEDGSRHPRWDTMAKLNELAEQAKIGKQPA